jgi:hypothetical protein
MNYKHQRRQWHQQLNALQIFKKTLDNFEKDVIINQV